MLMHCKNMDEPFSMIGHVPTDIEPPSWRCRLVFFGPRLAGGLPFDPASGVESPLMTPTSLRISSATIEVTIAIQAAYSCHFFRRMPFAIPRKKTTKNGKSDYFWEEIGLLWPQKMLLGLGTFLQYLWCNKRQLLSLISAFFFQKKRLFTQNHQSQKIIL